MEWDARRFQTFYGAFVKRKAAEELEKHRLAMISGIWGNTNFDEEQGTARQKFVEALQESVDDKIATIYGMAPKSDDFEIDEKNPFWAAMYRSLEKQHGTAKPTKEEVDRAIADQETGRSSDMPDLDVDQLE